ncbi:MAG: S16 family serine protease [Candidatus Nanopelagicales bacterium]|nr:S16 family serine protease [Candidatus Nanopelagicales bacterium]
MKWTGRKRHLKSRRGRPGQKRATAGFAALALAASLGLATACGPFGSGPDEIDEVTVRALWFGLQSHGGYEHGVTRVVVTGFHTPGSSEFKVDLSEFEAAGTVEFLKSSAWTAATLAALASAIDPRGWSIKFHTDERIEGPSAGGLLTLASSAAFANTSVPDNVSMTGAILPGGGLGHVGGIPEKIRAAAEAGITTVLIPVGQRTSMDPVTGGSVDVIKEGRSLGVDVREARSVWDAYGQLVGKFGNWPTKEPGPMDPDLAKLLRSRTKSALDRLSALKIAPAPTDATKARRRNLVSAVERDRQSASRSLAAGKLTEAAADATVAERSVLTWNATAAAIPGAHSAPERQFTDTMDLADSLESQAESALEEASQTPARFMEQLTTIPDALTLANDAITSVRAIQGNLSKGQDPVVKAATLVNAAAELEQVRFDLEVNLPTWLRAAVVTGHAPIPNRRDAREFLNSYADFLAQAALANLAYYEQTAKSSNSPAIPFDEAWTKVELQRWSEVKDATSWPQVSIKLATAISALSAGADLVASTGTVVDDSGTINAEGLIEIRDIATLKHQSDLALAEGADQSRWLAGADLDPNYSRMTNEYGHAVFNLPTGANIADQERRRGLVYQWYGNINAQLLLALSESFKK